MPIGIDDTLAIGGLAIAIPGLIDVAVRGGEYIADKIDTFGTTEKILHDFRDLGLDLSEGILFSQLQRLKSASRDPSIPQTTLSRLERLLKCVEDEQKAATQYLDKVRTDNFGKFKFTMWEKRRLQNRYEKFKEPLDEINTICTQIHQLQTSPSATFLPQNCFKVEHEVLGDHSGELLANSDIREVHGNYLTRGEKVQGKFILESKTREEDFRYISSLLDKSEQPFGLPRCLGYRQAPYCDPENPDLPVFELVFHAPTSTHQSLASLITNEPIPSFTTRKQLAKQVAKALQNVHTLQLVHKAVRPRVILVAGWNPTPGQNSVVYLLDWTYVRKTSGVSSMCGGDLSWSRMIYQHPDRQGSPGHYPETSYEPKHDIYSLGVVMLEILLWKPFITQVETPSSWTLFFWRPTPTNDEAVAMRISDIFEERAIRLGEANGGLPSRYAGDSTKLASRPNAIRNVWVSLAKEDLAQEDLAQGSKAAADIVVKCLEGGFTSIMEVVQAMDLIS